VNKKEQKRLAHEIIRMAPVGVRYTLDEAMELAECGAPWNLDWYIKGRAVVQADGRIRWDIKGA
jgi:hypothetical protein